MATVYDEAGVETWALWVPSAEVDLDGPDAVVDVGSLTRDTTTLVMHTRVGATVRPHEGIVETSVASLERVSEEVPLRSGDLGAPDDHPGLSAWVMVQGGVRWERRGRSSTEATADLRGRDAASLATEGCGSSAGRARAPPCLRAGARTASLQSTAMGQPLYESLGFVAAGRYEEWVSTAER